MTNRRGNKKPFINFQDIMRILGIPTSDSVEHDKKLFKDFARPRDPLDEFQIEYADRKGVITERKICITSASVDGKTFEAWCYLRDTQRKFRSDRVQKAIHIQSGKLVNNLAQYYLIHNTPN